MQLTQEKLPARVDGYEVLNSSWVKISQSDVVLEMSSDILSNGTTDNIDLLLGMQGNHRWIDDLPVCQQTSVGTSPQTLYIQGHSITCESEDRHFCFSLEDGCSLYGVFDGHDGSKLSNFVAQRIPAELLFDQLSGKETDQEIKDVLQQAFTAVERGYFESVMEHLSEKAALQFEIQENSNFGQSQNIRTKLQDVEAKLAGGTTATVVLIHNNKMFEVNVGNTQALLCKMVDKGIQVIQLSVDHTINNENELARLKSIGVDVDKLQRSHKLGNSENTRCIGDYSVKEGHKDIDILKNATSDPVIATPDLCESYEIDNSTAFLIIMSQGLYKAVQDIKPTEWVNGYIANLVAQEFSSKTPLKKVAQAVVNRVVCSHQQLNLQKHEDITLLVRYFNYPIDVASVDNTSSTPSSPYLSPNMPFFPHLVSPSAGSHVNPHSSTPQSKSSPSPSPNPYISSPTVVDNSSSFATGSNNNQPQNASNLNEIDNSRSSTKTQTLTNSPLSTQQTNNSLTSTNTNSTQSSGESKLINSHHHSTPKLSLDNDGKVEAHVDFSAFYSRLQEMTESQTDQLFNELRPKPDYDTIVEEPE